MKIFTPNYFSLVCNDTIEWRCALGDCIPIALKCDGESDCKDESDEICRKLILK